MKDKIEKNSIIVIDDEYPGHGRDIKQYLLKFLKIKKEYISFSLVGKKDLSHKIANQTFSGKLRPNKIIIDEELNLSKIISKKKLKEFLK